MKSEDIENRKEKTKMAKLVFKNYYSEQKPKPEFYTECDEEDMTDQSQLCQASIVEMAKKFGIDAIIAKAEQRTIENMNLQNELYGHDFTKMFNSVEETLNVKNRLKNVFENIPARIRKNLFNDSIADFINSYTTNDETKLTQLSEIGLISNTQLEQVKEYNRIKTAEKQENETRQRFVEKLNTMKEGLYETFKQNGTINLNNNENNASNNQNV